MNEFVVTINENKKSISINSDNSATIDGISSNYELKKISKNVYLLSINNKVYQLVAEYINTGSYDITTNNYLNNIVVRSAIQEKALLQIQAGPAGKLHKTNVFAPMPGMILRINKSEGDIVEAGDPVIILEAMKMENIIYASVKGTISNIYVTEGNAVEKGAILFNMELF